MAENGDRPQQNPPYRRNDGGGVSGYTAGQLAVLGDLGDIRVLAEGLAAARGEHPLHGAGDVSLRERQKDVSKRLLRLARDKGFFIEPSDVPHFGDKISLRSKESDVYYNKQLNRVFKVKDPFAASGLKKHGPEDAVYEHIVHNIFFPDTRYYFVGVTEKDGDLRFVFSQDYVQAVQKASDSESVSEATEKGFVKKDVYYMENEFVEITDTMGQNALVREDGSVAFIDPVISHKVPAREIIGRYLEADLSRRQVFGAKVVLEKPAKRTFWQAVGEFLGIRPKGEIRASFAQETGDGEEFRETAVRGVDVKKDSPEKMTADEFRLMVADRDPEALKQLEETGRYEGWFLKSKDYSDVFIVEKASDGSILKQDSDRAKHSMLDRYGEGEIEYAGLKFYVTTKQINEMAFGMPVELKCKETGEYSTFVYSIEKDEIVCKPSFERTLKEKLVEDERERNKERKVSASEDIADRGKGIGQK